MPNNPTIHVWITHYALTQGIFEADAEHCTSTSEKMIEVVGKHGYKTYYHKPFWHTSEAEAKQHVKQMIVAKRKSIKKQLEKLDLIERDLLKPL